MSRHEAQAGGGMFSRLEQILEVIRELPGELSDHEVEGVMEVLPPDTAGALRAVLAPHVRQVSLAFLKHTGRWLAEVRQAKEDGRKVILIPFNFPPEVIRVFKGAVPLTCEVLTTLGVATLEGQGGRYWDKAMELGIPDFLCSSSTVALGSLMSGDDFQPDAIVQSTAGACDANSKIHEFAALQMDLPQFFVERPTDSSPRGREQHWRYFSRFMGELQEFIGEELDEEHMRQVLEHANGAAAHYYDLYDLYRFAPCPVPNVFTLYSYSVRFSLWGTPEATALMRAMVELSEGRRQRGEYPAPQEVARCIWLYVGYYFDLWGLFSWMERRGISYLQDALSLYNPRHVDTSSMERMLRGLAQGAFDYPMTRQMGADSMTVAWKEDMVHAIKDLNANVAFYSGHHSCKQTWSVYARVRREIMERTGVPVLTLQGDSWNRQMTPISVLQEEIGAFVDTVVARKGRRRRRKKRRNRS